MHVVLAGGTGFIGTRLCQSLAHHGHRITLLTRDVGRSGPAFPPGTTTVHWDARGQGEWTRFIDEADGVINLAGPSIADGRWTPQRKALLLSARIEATHALVEAIRVASQRPRVLVNASAVGYYGDCGDEVITESHAPGHDFPARLCTAWEAAAMEAETLGVRVVRARIGIVLGADGGALQKFLLPFRLFVGGPLGHGKQWFPWIHRDDAVAILRISLERDDLQGPVNLAAPESVTMRRFASTLGSVLHRPALFPVPRLALRVALGEVADSLLVSQRIEPVVVRRHGYVFQYPTVMSALQAALAEH